MEIVVASRRASPAAHGRRWPGAAVVDVTSRGPEPWRRFSPFYPHGGIPVPGRAGTYAQSVEGLWQGLKVFEHEDTDPGKWEITSLRGIKRPAGGRRGAVRGHRFGQGEEAALLAYGEARRRIYLPAYRWTLENRLGAELDELRVLAARAPLVLLDYETNTDPDDLTRPLSHASLVKAFLESGPLP
ncbi:MAG: hypothetical protein INR65_12070 [Gluconacetobacter diazotrophicus]|nr:hypothetical protein [Gluconacetobacter diazotrophicus]